MAISAPHYQLMKSLKPILPQGGTVLQIGEANWYGDIAPEFPCENGECLWAVARDFYKDLFAPSRIVSIDKRGTKDALDYDLNQPLPIDDRFDVVINHGTAEHIFNIAQVFKTMNDRCEIGGTIIHESPFHGWIDHGFYCLQPTLFYDLAAANCYEVHLVAIETIQPPRSIEIRSREELHQLAMRREVPADSMLFVVYRKRFEVEFKLPMQGYYNNGLSDAGRQAWKVAR